MSAEEDDRLNLLDDNVSENGAFTINTERRATTLIHLSKFYNLDVKNVWIITAVIALLATVCLVLFPSFLNSANDHADTYTALLFCSLSSTFIVSVATLVFKLCDRSLRLTPRVSYRWLLPMGVLYGACGLAIFYSRDRNKVMCHLQDPLSAVLLPSTVLFHMLQPKVDKVSQLICIAAAIIGLFISVDFQIWDEFSCHGDLITTFADDGGGWSSKVHVIWSLCYVAAFVLLAFFYVTLDKEIKLFTGGNNSVSIPLEGIYFEQDPSQPSTSQDVPAVIISNNTTNRRRNCYKIHFGNILVLFLWLQFISTLTILLFFWTDFISTVGKAESASDFNSLLQSGFSCYFGVGRANSTGIRCSLVALFSWTFIICFTLLLAVIMYFMAVAKQCSVTYLIGVLVLCLPLSTIWWSFFQTGQNFQWAPMFSGETGFTLVGLPIMMASLILYKYYADRETVVQNT